MALINRGIGGPGDMALADVSLNDGPDEQNTTDEADVINDIRAQQSGYDQDIEVNASGPTDTTVTDVQTDTGTTSVIDPNAGNDTRNDTVGVTTTEDLLGVSTVDDSGDRNTTVTGRADRDLTEPDQPETTSSTTTTTAAPDNDSQPDMMTQDSGSALPSGAVLAAVAAVVLAAVASAVQ